MKDRKVALVTGGAKRVGRAIVERMREAGYAVAFTYHSSHELAAELIGEDLLAIQADLARSSGVAKALSGFKRRFNRLDLLVNNASLYLPGDEKLDAMLAIHLHAPLKLARELTPLLKASNGYVINMVDLLAEKPMPGYAAYCASKAALLNLTLSLARELAPQVTVNGIAPGVVAWPDDMHAAARKQYLKRVPLAKAGRPEDVAELIHFLATKGNYITGQILHLDGGRSIA